MKQYIKNTLIYLFIATVFLGIGYFFTHQYKLYQTKKIVSTIAPIKENNSNGIEKNPVLVLRLKNPEVWMDMYRGDPAVLGQPDALWSYVKQHISAFEFARSNIDPIWMSYSNLQQLVAMIKKNNIPMNMELFGPNTFASKCPIDDSNGICSADYDMTHFIDPVENLGGHLHFLNLDWQIQILLQDLKVTYPSWTYQQRLDKSRDYLVDYIKTIRQKYPNTEFFLLSNFPNWRWKGAPSNPLASNWGDYWDVVSTIVPGTKNAGVPLRGITIDYPYNYMTQRGQDMTTWVQRVRDFEKYARSNGLEFNLIINSQQGGQTSDAAFASDTLSDIGFYQAAGGHPDRYIVETWYPHPVQVVPETSLNSMTNLIMRVIQKLGQK